MQDLTVLILTMLKRITSYITEPKRQLSNSV